MQQLGSHWTDFHEILYLSIFRKSFEKFQVSLKSDKNNSTLHEDQYTFLSYLAQLFLERKMFRTKVVEKLETHF